MQNANNLNTSLNSINSGESAALADINRRTTDANNAYNSGLASANAQIEADYIKNLLAEREKELNRQLQERQFNESVRQFNENLALQKQQLQQRFSSGSGGGRSYSRSSYGSSGDNDVVFTGPSDVSIKSVSSPSKFSSTKASKWYVKNAAGLTSKNKLDAAIKSGLSKGTITKKDAKAIYKVYGIKTK